MAQQISKGTTFLPGVSYDQTDFNNLVDNAVLLPGCITSQADIVPTSTDSFLFYESGGNTLAQCTQAELVSSIPSGAANGVFALRKLGSVAGMAAPGNDARFPANVTGIRMGNGASPDTAATPDNIAFPSVALPTTGGVIDFNAGNLFSAGLTSNATYTFTNLYAGAQITVVIKLNGFTCTLPAPNLGNLLVVGSGTTAWQYVYTASGNGVTAIVFKI